MSQLIDNPVRTYQAASAMAAYLRVKLNGSNKLAVCGAGASENEVGTLTKRTTAADEYVGVRAPTASGTCKMIAAGAFSREAVVYAAASGKIDDTVNGKPIGIALEAATADGDVVEVLRINATVIVAADDCADDTALSFGSGTDGQLLWSTGDADNHSLVLALGDDNQTLHITDKGAKATDWNVAAATHPTVMIHSNTTPATDYLSIGGHDGTTATIDVVGGTTLALSIAGAAIANVTGDGIALAVDDDCFFAGASSDCGFGFMDADASNHTMVIFTDDTSQQIHITDKGAKDTDWNLAAGTHPTVYIHSNTTPATDYLSIGGHDGTTATIDVGGGTTLALSIAGSAIGGVKATGLYVGTYVAAGTTAGDNQLTLQSTGTAPSGTGANVGHIYADYETDDDELFYLSGTGGTASQLTT